MIWRAELYEQYAKSSFQAANRIDNPEDREMLVKMARLWMQEAKSEAERPKAATMTAVAESRRGGAMGRRSQSPQICARNDPHHGGEPG